VIIWTAQVVLYLGTVQIPERSSGIRIESVKMRGDAVGQSQLACINLPAERRGDDVRVTKRTIRRIIRAFVTVDQLQATGQEWPSMIAETDVPLTSWQLTERGWQRDGQMSLFM
jgi:hypothetical protein